MITGFEIFGATTGGLGVLNLTVAVIRSLSEFISDYKGTGKHLLKISTDFDIFQSALLTWAGLWEISNDTREESCELIWGRPGWQAIERQLTVIDTINDDFTVLLCKWLPDGKIEQLEEVTREAVKQKRTQLGRRSQRVQHERGTRRSRARRVDLFREQANRLRDITYEEDRISYILGEKKKLEDFVTELNGRFSTLQEQAELYFASAHPEIDRGTSVNHRRRIVANRSFFQQCLNRRPASEALYWACKDAEVGVPALDLHLPDASTGSGEQTGISTLHAFYEPRYYLSISNHTRQFDIIIEGSGAPTASSFAEAERHLRHLQFSTFEADRSIFGMSRAVDPLAPDTDLPYRNLAGMFMHIHTLKDSRAYKHFLRSDQMTLALDVVELGLLTLGTAWTYGLDSHHIQPRAARGVKRRYLFNATGIHRSGLRSVEPHLFNIGVLLVEVALRRPVLRVKQVRVEQLIELDLIFGEGDESDNDSHDEEAHDEDSDSESETEPNYLVATRAIRHVERCTNLGFAKAVAFCLQQTPGTRRPRWVDTQRIPDWESRDRVYRGILDQYYREVYLPYANSLQCIGDTY